MAVQGVALMMLMGVVLCERPPPLPRLNINMDNLSVSGRHFRSAVKIRLDVTFLCLFFQESALALHLPFSFMLATQNLSRGLALLPGLPSTVLGFVLIVNIRQSSGLSSALKTGKRRDCSQQLHEVPRSDLTRQLDRYGRNPS